MFTKIQHKGNLFLKGVSSMHKLKLHKGKGTQIVKYKEHYALNLLKKQHLSHLQIIKFNGMPLHIKNSTRLN